MHGIWQKVSTICAAASLAFGAFSAVSETLVAPSTFVVYQGDITQWLTEQIAPYLVPNTVLTSQLNLTQPYNTIVHNPEWNGAATFNWTKSATNNVWVFDITTTNLVVTASEFEVHDNILETIGGSTIPVAVNAVCQNLTLTLPGVWKIHGELPLSWSGTNLSAPLQNFLLTPSATQPVLTLGSCTGPTGLATFLNARIAAGFKTPAAMQTMAATQVQSFVTTQLQKVNAKIGKPYSFSILGVNISFTPTTPSNQTNGTWLLDGTMVMTGGGPATTTTIPKDYADDNLSDADATGFAFSTVNFWPAVLTFVQNAGVLEGNLLSSNVSAFTSFMQNRFEQMAVWQDLWNFPTTSVFNFALMTTAAPQIASEYNLQKGGVQLNLSAPIDVLMSAPVKSAWVPYVEFGSTSPASLQLNAAAGKTGNLAVTYSLESAPVTYNYRKEYAAIRKETDGIDTSSIASSVVSAYQNQTWSYTIPATASVFPGDTMSFKNIFFGPATFRIELAIEQAAAAVTSN